MKAMLVVMALLVLAGCSGTLPVSGETVDGEKFSGTFSRRTDGIGGTVTLVSDKGPTCDGRWHLDDVDRMGSVVLKCSDGRTGTAELDAGQPNGTMRGMLGGKRFEGIFEDPTQPAAR